MTHEHLAVLEGLFITFIFGVLFGILLGLALPKQNKSKEEIEKL